MNLSNPEPKFTVYVHTSPAGKHYVGITCRRLIERWGSDGRGYQDNKHFWSAIQKYGWDNFTHQIVGVGLSLEDASDLEMRLISEYNAMDPNYGYNQTTGGNWSRPSPEVRALLSARIRERYKDPEFCARMIELNRKGHLGKKLSFEHRHHLSIASLGRFKGVKRGPMSKEACEHMRGRVSWSKGLNKQIDYRLRNTSRALKGRQFLDDSLSRMSRTRLDKFASGYSPVWITNGVIETTYDSAVESLPDGFSLGRLDRNRRYVHKGADISYVAAEDVATYLQDGWKLGRGPDVGETIRKMKQKYVFIVDEIRFDTAAQAADYLHSHGFPNIVSSTVTELCRRGFSHSKTYASLENRLRRENINEN